MKRISVAILGIGGRGGDAYGNIINDKKEEFQIVALCDLKKERLKRFAAMFNVEDNALFTDEDEFFKQRRADALIIATQDNDHVRHLLKAMPLSYDILVEKPLTASPEETKTILEAQRKYGNKVLVCHVLRYAPAFVKVGEMLRKGDIGKLILIDALERVCFWHQAHSYVRGNWRNTEVAMPMILAKCCHDLDLIQYYADSKCKSVSSIGDLAYFKRENAPENSGERCLTCKAAETCPYNAKSIYINWWNVNKPEDVWPFNIVADAPVTEEKLYKALENGPYGKCVYKCDNDVVDHQIVSMTFENGVKATLTMTGFTAGGGRRIVFHGSLGEIVLDEEENKITLAKYGKKKEEIDIGTLTRGDKGYGHGGGDARLIEAFYKTVSGEAQAETSLDKSIESHLIGICAEKSRLMNGKLIYIHDHEETL